MASRKVLVIGDVHAPFACNDTLKAVYSAASELKPKVIVQVGDLFDFFSASKFPRKHDVMTPEQEFEEGRKQAEAFWANLTKACPSAEKYQLLGNHCVRPHKRVLENCPELYSLVVKSWEDLYKFRGVDTLFDVRDDLEIDGVVYEHGFYTQPGRHMRYNMRPTVFGHTHRPWVHYERIRGQMLWEMNVGFVADAKHEALKYTPKKHNPWVRGHGVVENGWPYFYPLEKRT